MFLLDAGTAEAINCDGFIHIWQGKDDADMHTCIDQFTYDNLGIWMVRVLCVVIGHGEQIFFCMYVDDLLTAM